MRQLKKANNDYLATNVDPESLPGLIDLLKQEVKIIQNENVL